MKGDFMGNQYNASYRLIICFCIFFVFSFEKAQAQDATVYVSPHDLGKTLSNIYFSIDKNGFTYVNTNTVKAKPSATSQYKGTVQVIIFETTEMSKIISCEPTAVLDFPLKIVVWEDENDIYLAYINPMILKRRHLISGCEESLGELNRSLIRVVNDAIRTQ